jgi:hypothetical protein
MAAAGHATAAITPSGGKLPHSKERPDSPLYAFGGVGIDFRRKLRLPRGGIRRGADALLWPSLQDTDPSRPQTPRRDD